MNVNPLPDLRPANPIQAGSQSQFIPAGLIDLDLPAHASKDPSSAVLETIAAKAGCQVAEIKQNINDLAIEKGFKSEKGTNEPIPIHTYSNPPGPDCYYFVRHWRVTYTNPTTHQEEELHFTKKIYTNVQVPQILDGAKQKQQQYIAALAARTYAKIEEARIMVGAGQASPLHDSIAPHIAKVARDRFVTLEMFQNGKKISINPSTPQEIQNITIDHIQIKFREGRTTNANEEKKEGFHTIRLTDETAKDSIAKPVILKTKEYQLKEDGSTSSHVRKISSLLKKDEILANINRNISVDEAFKKADVTKEEILEFEKGNIKSRVDNFYSHVQFFSDKSSINSLMSRYGNNFQITETTLKRITPKDPSLLERIKNKKPDDLAILERMKDRLDNGKLSDPQKNESRMLLEAYKRVFNQMVTDHIAINAIEKDMTVMGFNIDSSHSQKRRDLLNNLTNLIEKLDAGLPPVQVQQKAEVNQDNQKAALLDQVKKLENLDDF